MMHAYPETYLNDAMNNLGNMFDYGLVDLHYDPERFYEQFLTSGVAKQFEQGNPKYVAGLSGPELAIEVIYRTEDHRPTQMPSEEIDKSPEYWAGWALAYYQWYTGRTFIKIYKVVSVQELLDMYDVYHEMDIQKFVDEINERWEAFYTDTNLKRIRLISGLSQRELAELSNVPLRQIQLFEQRQRNINHTRAIDVLKLAKILGCKSEELLEI